MSIQDDAPPLHHVSSVRGEIGLLGHHPHGLTVATTAVFAIGEMAGSGVLALPSALAAAGYIGIVLMFVCAYISAYTGDILGQCWVMVQDRYEDYQQHTRYPYPAIGQVTYGKIGRFLVSFCINYTMFGASVVYLLLASQNIQDIVHHAGYNISFCLWLPIVAGVLLPLSWLGTPKDFWPIAVAAALATTVACVIIVVNMMVDKADLPPVYHAKMSVTDFFMAFGTICFAFGGHPAFPTFQADMRQPEKFGRAIFIAYFGILIMYLPVAIGGYFIYGSNVNANVLISLSSGPMRTTVEVLITLHLFCGFIIIINPVCQELEEMLGIPQHFNFKRVLTRTAMMACVLFVAESIPHFGAILSLIGGSAVTALAYIFPPMFYLKLCSMEGPWEEKRVKLHEKAALIEIVLVGLILGGASTYSAVVALASSSFTEPCYINLHDAGS